MSLIMGQDLLSQIQSHGERAYPEEGAGFLLGIDDGERLVQDVIGLSNAREPGARRNRYLIEPKDYIQAEQEAERRNLSLLGVFHSHPDHPDQPSEFDREWAQPAFSYIITSVNSGRAVSSKSWRLSEDRMRFAQEEIRLAGSRR